MSVSICLVLIDFEILPISVADTRAKTLIVSIEIPYVKKFEFLFLLISLFFHLYAIL